MLTKTALLNGIQLAVDQIARMLVGFILTPILVTQLGSVLFGVWQILQKSSLQVAALDGRSSEVLKWVIAGQQNNTDDEAKQRAVGSAVICFLLFIPILVLAYAILIIYLPYYLNLNVGQILDVRYAIIILCIGAVILVAADLFEATIRGMNLAYKLTGVQAVVLVLGGFLSAFVALKGYGLPGLALVQVIVSLLFITSYYVVARRHVQWLGMSKPSSNEVRQSFNRSKWYTLWAFISVWLFTGDVIVLGVLVEPEFVSKYVLTMYVSQIMTVAILTAVSSALPGLAGIIGKGEYKRAELLRQESILYSWWLSVTICSTVILFNYSFISLWVGEQYYAGHTLNFLIAICVMQLVFIRHDANMLNLALDVRKKVMLGFVSALVTLVLMLILVPRYELAGLCTAILLGRGILSVAYPIIVGDFLKSGNKNIISLRHLFFTTSLLLFSWALSRDVYLDSWWKLMLGAVLSSAVIFILVYWIGTSASEKRLIINRYRLFRPVQS